MRLICHVASQNRRARGPPQLHAVKQDSERIAQLTAKDKPITVGLHPFVVHFDAALHSDGRPVITFGRIHLGESVGRPGQTTRSSGLSRSPPVFTDNGSQPWMAPPTGGVLCVRPWMLARGGPVRGYVRACGPRSRRACGNRPNVAMDRVVRHIQLTTDIPLRQIAAQELEHPELPRCQLAIFRWDAADLRWPLKGRQCLGQDPRIRAMIEDRSCIGYRDRGRLVLAHGPKHRRLAEQRRPPGGWPKVRASATPCSISGSASSGLPCAASDTPSASGTVPDGLLRAMLPPELGCRLGQDALLLDTAPLTGDQRSIGQRRRARQPLGARGRQRRRFREPLVGLVTLTLEVQGHADSPASQRPPRRTGPSSSAARRAFSSWAPTSPQGKPARSIVRLAQRS